MTSTTIAEGIGNWERLQDFVQEKLSEDSVLKQRSRRFVESLKKRQERETRRILSRPGTKAYKDFMSVPV